MQWVLQVMSLSASALLFVDFPLSFTTCFSLQGRLQMCRSLHIFIFVYLYLCNFLPKYFVTFYSIFLGNFMLKPLLSSCRNSWLQVQRSGFDSWCYQIFWEVVGLKRGPLSLVSTIEELLGRKSIGSGLENLEYSSRDPSRWPRNTICPQKLALTSRWIIPLLTINRMNYEDYKFHV
jgi:hypothetical protein